MVLVLDDFLLFPRVEREKALHAEYKPFESQGMLYPGIAPVEDDEDGELIRKLIPGGWTGEVTCFYRRFLESDPQGTFIHNDAALAKFTALIYLNEKEQYQGGSAFWKHKATQIESQPESGDESLFAELRKDGLDEKKWERLSFVKMQFNRLVLFDSKLFHSRYPKQNFGDKTSNARLLKVFFFQ